MFSVAAGGGLIRLLAALGLLSSAVFALALSIAG